MGMVTLNQKDQLRSHVLQHLDNGSQTVDEAAQLLQVTPRHMWRLLSAYRRHGVRSIPHGNRGRRPKHALDPHRAAQALELLDHELQSCNNAHAAELLAERGLPLSPSSVRRLRQQAGLPMPRTRRRSKHRRRRERKPQAGMMLQIDGSPHRWLGADGQQWALLAAIDDATNEVFARFQPTEDLMGYLALLQTVIRRKGVPLSLYADRHSIFRSPKADRLSVDEQLTGQAPKTQFGRACADLGITIISARSPQAKGRVENLFGTLQDRLVNELQIAGVTDWAQAQAFLPGFLKRYNKRFNKPAAEVGSAYRPAPGKDVLAQALCLKFERVIANDHTVSFARHRLTLPPLAYSLAGQKVTLCLTPDGRLTYWHQGQLLGPGPRLEGRLLADLAALSTCLPAPPITPPAPLPVPTHPRRAAGTAVTPAPDHPWRRGYDARQARRAAGTIAAAAGRQGNAGVRPERRPSGHTEEREVAQHPHLPPHLSGGPQSDKLKGPSRHTAPAELKH